MFRIDDMYGDYPTLDEIRRDYDELISMIGDLSTIGEIMNFKKKDRFTIEINGEYLDDFINSDSTNEDIKEIRYASYGCLAYIYVYVKNGIVDDIIFDVWSNKWQSEFIINTSMDDVESNYDTYLQNAKDVYRY